ncbi:hypothetical protein CEXT_291091 [Caerostris extrusa]|uniref:Uncharacterized protein n=1 Tax=Caerostris extrusa TaxID=172846 RepID=A0AAV4NRF5_CAEEX|nr:hypothetical protein CEXT_291091 [Caerostris extrusa]
MHVPGLLHARKFFPCYYERRRIDMLDSYCKNLVSTGEHGFSNTPFAAVLCSNISHLASKIHPPACPSQREGGKYRRESEAPLPLLQRFVSKPAKAMAAIFFG